MLSFVKLHHHTSENIRIKFEDEMDRCGVRCFQVVTDIAAKMKCAFQIVDDTAYNQRENHGESSDDEDVNDEASGDLSYWSPQPLFSFQWMDWMCCSSTSTCCTSRLQTWVT